MAELFGASGVPLTQVPLCAGTVLAVINADLVLMLPGSRLVLGGSGPVGGVECSLPVICEDCCGNADGGCGDQPDSPPQATQICRDHANADWGGKFGEYPGETTDQ
ncbi:Uncharacterised protein [Rhodococcus coprophilus]|uniref:Uncharacterized protein n=1 Tax=Rhodococcus coprophilus TaxID=38310 RepID=A0A2X4TMD0_9NOCA|nr:Uncharacterised protein [Rhodococcus coprophilus]